MQLLREYPNKVSLGFNRDGQQVFMTKPEWSCDWYWSFGWLSSKDTHTQLKWLGDSCLYNNINDYFSPFALSDKARWTFCELVESIYTLKQSAELFYLGGSHISRNPLQHQLINKDWANHINEVLIPNQIDEVYKVLGL